MSLFRESAIFVVAESLHKTKILVSLFSEDQQFIFLQKDFFKKKAKEAAVSCSQEMSTKVQQHFAVVVLLQNLKNLGVLRLWCHTHTYTHTIPVNVKPNKRGK
jgi:hypothetical protein